MKRTFIIVFFSVLFFLICGAPTISFKVMKPAYINVPGYIKNIGLVNRSGQSDKSSNILEGALTAELPGGDKISSQSALEGLASVMQNSGRFNVSQVSEIFTKNAPPESFPQPLSWTEIDNLCYEHKVDGIIALEVYDSDYIITSNTIRVTVGFRFYIPKERIILDQNTFEHEMVWQNQINSIGAAINRFVEKERAIKDVSYDAGLIYGDRITPSWTTIYREYYRKSKGDQNLREGARMMEVNNWDAANEALLKAVESKKRKTRGRAAHNIAVVYEILGDYEMAKKWAQDAWGKYENKGSKNYAYILGERIRENNILQEQSK